MSDITDRWVLEAKVALLTKALAESQLESRANGEDAINQASEVYRLTCGTRSMALTLRKWAVAAGGHTPSAIVASKLLELIGDEKSGAVETEHFNADDSPKPVVTP